jgi:GNAT superfamily N-acetyltransferase
MADPVVSINRITLGEIAFVLDIQQDCYGEGYIEDSHTFTLMIAIHPQGCLGVNVDGSLAGYVFFHPYRENVVKPLDFSHNLDGTEDCMYLHDMAVHHRYRGMGLTRMLMERVDHETKRRGFEVQCLVAVQNSRDFWSKYEFITVRKIVRYGEGPAYYMIRYL